jgi:hypothetical protein
MLGAMGMDVATLRGLIVGAIVACVSCSAPRAAQRPSVLTAAPAQKPPPTPPSIVEKARAACEDAKRTSKAALDEAVASAHGPQPTSQSPSGRETSAPTWQPVCLMSDARAWIIRLGDVELNPLEGGGAMPRAWLEFGVVDARDGERWEKLPGFQFFLADLSEFEAVDLDGDGKPELTWVDTPEHPEGMTVAVRSFLTYRGGAVRAFEFPGDTWEDVDHDGRMDAVSARQDYVHTFRWQEIALRRVRHLLHQLPDGTFVSDALSREFLRRDCPAPPADVIARDARGNLDEGETAFRLECARLWAVDAQTLIARLDATCTARPAADGTLQPGPNACLFREALERTVEDTKPALR